MASPTLSRSVPDPAAAPAPAHASASVLVVDDEPGMRSFLAKSLSSRFALVESAGTVEEAEALRSRLHFDLILLDIRLPGRSGLEWLTELREQGVGTEVIVMTAYADLETAVAALRSGAADFLFKPFRLEQVLKSVDRSLEGRQARRENFVLRRERGDEPGLDGIVGEDASVRDMCAVIRRVAPTASTVLVQGETGTGKELVARALHRASGRGGPFVPVNCGSIAPELLESELFGHTRGAFTGASSAREGLFSYADKGTLFLDEISEMSLPMQAKLLRALESKRVRPVGADRELPVDARVVAATNRRLAPLVSEGRFREDLLFRLDVLTITVPPLRERRRDLPALARHFTSLLADELGVAPLVLDEADLEALAAHDWPGNVRELKNVLERATLLGRRAAELVPVGAPSAPHAPVIHGPPLDWALADVERHHALRVLDSADGNKSRAARRLGISRKTLDRKLKSWRA